MRVRKRLRRIKRLVYLGAARRRRGRAAAGEGGARRPHELGPPATWPPLSRPSRRSPRSATSSRARSTATDEPTPEPAPPVSDEPVAAVGAVADRRPRPGSTRPDGGCPLTHPVKANGNSGIYHVPGGQFYERTRAERCYVDAAAAEADGYRAAKGS